MMILDAYCGEGGAAMGLHRVFPKARIVGVDIVPQKRYPFEFYEANALWFLEEYGAKFDFIWTSPPCQRYSRATLNTAKGNHPDLVEPTRTVLKELGKPYIIENVPLSPLNPNVWLCGTMFSMKIFRHRLFECSFDVPQPPHEKHTDRIGWGKNDFVCVVRGRYDSNRPLLEWVNAMEVDWMSREGLAQAVPPAYSMYLAQYIPL